jgi:hypothetical protein
MKVISQANISCNSSAYCYLHSRAVHDSLALVPFLKHSISTECLIQSKQRTLPLSPLIWPRGPALSSSRTWRLGCAFSQPNDRKNWHLLLLSLLPVSSTVATLAPAPMPLSSFWPLLPFSWDGLSIFAPAVSQLKSCAAAVLRVGCPPKLVSYQNNRNWNRN